MTEQHDPHPEPAPATEVAIGVLVEPAPDAPHPHAGQWRILIARRPHDGVLGGYWEFPGGKREPGEALAHCLAREFQEELGIAVHVTDALPALEHTYDHGRVRLCPFFCRRQDTQAPQALAVTEWRWIAPDALNDYRFPPPNAPLVGHIQHALRRPPQAQ